MGRRVFRFDRVVPSATVASSFGTGPPGPPEFVLRRQEPPMGLRDEVIFLLHTAAEIEHALLAQYLYAQYSLDDSAQAYADWRSTIMEIAREEMAHLLSMQNLLRGLGGPLNFEREDYPFNAFYPFPFTLEPLTLRSVARYVLAEMPDPAVIPAGLGFDLAQVKADAGVTSPDSMVNRVGALFALLGELVAQLDAADFRPESADLQGLDTEWGVYGDMIVAPVTDKASALDLIARIGAQGEGPGDLASGNSHFRKFFDIYTAVKNGSASLPSKPLAVNPTVYRTDAGPLPGTAYIDHPEANAWAALLDTRYRIVLASMAHALARERQTGGAADPRQELIDWAVFGDMPFLTRIADRLCGLPLAAAGGPPRSGPPFDLPYTLNLPDREPDRWRHQLALLAESAARIAVVRQRTGGTDQILDDIEDSDRTRETFVTAQLP